MNRPKGDEVDPKRVRRSFRTFSNAQRRSVYECRGHARGSQRTDFPAPRCLTCTDIACAHLAQILDLILKDGQLNVHAGEVEVRPPPAPTTRELSETPPITKP